MQCSTLISNIWNIGKKTVPKNRDTKYPPPSLKNYYKFLPIVYTSSLSLSLSLSSIRGIKIRTGVFWWRKVWTSGFGYPGVFLVYLIYLTSGHLHHCLSYRTIYGPRFPSPLKMHYFHSIRKIFITYKTFLRKKKWNSLWGNFLYLLDDLCFPWLLLAEVMY